MKRRPLLFLVLAILCAGVYWACAEALEPGDWPVFEAFRCRDCGGPASVDPHNAGRWACLSCKVVTWRPFEHFASDEHASARALRAAGCLAIPEEHIGHTPSEAWSADRSRHW